MTPGETVNAVIGISQLVALGVGAGVGIQKFRDMGARQTRLETKLDALHECVTNGGLAGNPGLSDKFMTQHDCNQRHQKE